MYFQKQMQNELTLVASINHSEAYDSIHEKNCANAHAAADYATEQAMEKLKRFAAEHGWSIKKGKQLFFQRLCHNMALISENKCGVLDISYTPCNNLYFSLCTTGLSFNVTNIMGKRETEKNYINMAWFTLQMDVPIRIISAHTDPAQVIITASIPQFFN